MRLNLKSVESRLCLCISVYVCNTDSECLYVCLYGSWGQVCHETAANTNTGILWPTACGLIRSEALTKG